VMRIVAAIVIVSIRILSSLATLIPRN
jgi:hypothetical protein